MGHSYEYEHLGEGVPHIAPPTKIVVAGDRRAQPAPLRYRQGDALLSRTELRERLGHRDVEVLPFPPFPYDWEMAASDPDAGESKNTLRPTLRQRIRRAFRMTW